MSIIKWEPFGEMNDSFNRLFPALLGMRPRWVSESGHKAFEWAPSADISETEAEYLIRADLPAVRKEDVRITIDQGVITITGERKDKKEQKDEKFHRVESFQGSFARSFTVPDNVDETQIRAESKDGVLIVHLPKTPVTKAKAVEVKVQ